MTFGQPLKPEAFGQLGEDDQSPERIAAALHDHVAALDGNRYRR